MKFLVSAIMLSAVAFFVLLTCVNSVAAAEEAKGPYPVWWEPVIKGGSEHYTLRLENLADAEWHLTDKLPNGLHAELHKDGDPEKEIAVADTCVLFRSLTNAGFSGVGRFNEHVTNDIDIFCRTFEFLGGAIPARKSFVRDFVFYENALDYLPAFVDLAISCDFACRYYFANEERIPLRRTSHDFYEKIVVIDERQIKMSYTYLRSTLGTRLKVLARGDFNRDGLEDLLIRSNVILPRSSISDLFVASRDAPDAVFYVVYPEMHGCSAHSVSYRCDPATHDISEWRDAK